MSESLKKYWRSQLLGWALVHGFLALQSVQAIVTGQETLPRVVVLSPASWVITVLASHCLYLWAVREAVSAKHFRQYWPVLLQLIILVSLVTAVLYWVLLQGLALFLPPPETRSASISGVFDSFLLFILNFTLVNCVLMALWWGCFMLLSSQKLMQLDTGHRATPPQVALDVDSPIMISDGKTSRLITPCHIECVFAEGNYVKLVGSELKERQGNRSLPASGQGVAEASQPVRTAVHPNHLPLVTFST